MYYIMVSKLLSISREEAEFLFGTFNITLPYFEGEGVIRRNREPLLIWCCLFLIKHPCLL